MEVHSEYVSILTGASEKSSQFFKLVSVTKLRITNKIIIKYYIPPPPLQIFFKLKIV